jgi:eukaryotic-like serine/threonine-protein kinase
LNKPIPFGKYYLLERINVGGMAEVFKGKAFGVEGFERLVAVKRILPNIAEDEEFITMFIDEAKIAVQLQHANIAQIFDLGKVDDSYFIALEYVHGKDLRAIFDHLAKTEGAMPMAQACFIVMQVCEGLDYAHNKRDAQGRELNLVHRDVSPQNVLIGYEGEIKLVDFGIAKAAGKASKTQAGILKGKFGYMSPEQVRGLPVDRRSDIFSLGIVLYELLTGERLFVGESDFSTLEKVRNVEILPPSSFNKKIPAELERIALKALAKDVEDRYQNAIDLHDDLQAFLYSVGEFYSRKDLSAWMKKTFSDELEEANAKLEQLQSIDRVDEPTPLPPVGLTPRPSNSRSGSAPKAASKGDLEWDDEELETQIFDKSNDEQPQITASGEDDDELNSQDMVLETDQPEYGDDKTVAGTPSAELLAEAEAQLARVPVRTATLPQRTLTPGRGLGGPPPGISAFRHPTPNMGPAGAVATQSYGINAYDGSGSGLRSPYDGAPAAPAIRQTLTGMPAPLPQPTMGIPDRRPLEHFQRTGSPSKAPYLLLFLAVLGGGGFVGYRYLMRPGKLQIVVKPQDAQISIDEQVLKGTSPITVERPPRKVYHLAVERDGYVRKDENIRLEAGQFERVELELEPSPDTGFELTSEPPGGLVWLDGQPFTSGDENAQQARTNFKAYRVAPGRHVIEIKGDPRYEDWKQEFFQEPGKTLKLRAELKPHMGGGPGAPPVVASAPKPAPAVKAPEPKPEPPKPVEKPVAAAPVAQTPPPVAKPTPPPAAAPAAPKAVAQAAPPRPRPPRPAARPRVTEDVFETETKLGAAAAAPSGGDCMLTVGSKPWSEVWIDGKSTGKVTPLVDYKLACGRHKVTFKNPEIPVEKTETVTLKAGEKFKKVFALVDTGE